MTRQALSGSHIVYEKKQLTSVAVQIWGRVNGAVTKVVYESEASEDLGHGARNQLPAGLRRVSSGPLRRVGPPRRGDPCDPWTGVRSDTPGACSHAVLVSSSTRPSPSPKRSPSRRRGRCASRAVIRRLGEVISKEMTFGSTPARWFQTGRSQPSEITILGPYAYDKERSRALKA